MFHILAFASIFLTFHTDLTNAVCGESPVLWRNDNVTCPPRAICADVFNSMRDWYNGTTCQEKRVLSNCICPGNQVCPYNNPAHMLYSSAIHKVFTCSPVCNLPWCPSVQLARNPLGGVPSRNSPNRGSATVSLTNEQAAEEFLGRNYYRMNCRCPRHHFPVSRQYGRSRSVSAYRYQYNFQLRRFATLYVCNTGRGDVPHDDPCPRADVQ